MPCHFFLLLWNLLWTHNHIIVWIHMIYHHMSSSSYGFHNKLIKTRVPVHSLQDPWRPQSAGLSLSTTGFLSQPKRWKCARERSSKGGPLYGVRSIGPSYFTVSWHRSVESTEGWGRRTVVTWAERGCGLWPQGSRGSRTTQTRPPSGNGTIRDWFVRNGSLKRGKPRRKVYLRKGRERTRRVGQSNGLKQQKRREQRYSWNHNQTLVQLKGRQVILYSRHSRP